MVMPFGRSDAGLECLSDYRACVAQRTRTFLRARHVVSTIVCWFSLAFGVGGDYGARQGGLFAEQASQPVNEPYRHTRTLPRLGGIAGAGRVFPVLWKAWCRILAPRDCRRSQQEIKRCFGRLLPPSRLRKTLRLRRATELDRRLPAHPPSRYIFAALRSRSSRVCREDFACPR
jgi:hypothetical protein